MSKAPLTRPSWWDSDIARDILRDRVVTTSAGIGDMRLQLSGEPLLRHDGKGGLLQSVRLRLRRPGAASRDTLPRITRARVTTSGGTPVPCEILPGPGADTRVLVPEVDAPTRLLIELPDLEEGTRFGFEARPQRHWTLHLVQHSHLDIGYTDPQGRVMAIPFPFAKAFRTGYLGQASGELSPEPGGVVPVDVPALGTAAVTLRLHPSTAFPGDSARP
ncbi:hypothetical protein [Streptomyces sp. NPDC102462]|uniref:hypothetical protein n=1 Tax=Streptomyces sp. NPDC102462 TaxID=3366178 RepID=UPI00381B1613